MTAAPPTRHPDQDGNLDRVFKALADPTRRAIVVQLTSGEATMTQIASRFDMTLPGVSKHVTVLEDAGLVRRWRSGRSRLCRLEIQQLKSANAWIASQTQFWTDSLDALAAFVEDDAAT